MSNFKAFGTVIAKRIATLFRRGLVYEMDIDADKLWEFYLAAFPPESNPMYRKRTEHDCSCCRSFVRHVGHLVSIQEDGQIETIWDVPAYGPYAVVAAAMAAKVREVARIRGVFVTKDAKYGVERNREERVGYAPINWDHFHCEIPPEKRKEDAGTVRGTYAAAHQVLSRGLAEIKPEVLDRLLQLLQEGNVYRLADFGHAIRDFRTLQRAAVAKPNPYFAWANVNHKAALFRNTAIGTFAIDLSEGMPEAQAIARFTQKMNPQNYQMPTAPISATMADKAVQALQAQGLDVAVQRRFACATDIPVTAVLFVDPTTRTLLRGGLADVLANAVTRKEPAGTDISGEEFFTSVLPEAQSLRLFVSNAHLSNFVTLTAPTDEDAPALFSWDNGIAWVYDGGFADSITQRVKKAGGNINALLRVSLSWHNRDDLDIHAYVTEVSGIEKHIYFRDKLDVLDVDMNAGPPYDVNAVENLAWNVLVDGTYTIKVNNYNKRDARTKGFEIEYAYDGQTQLWEYVGDLAQGAWQTVATLTVRNRQVVDVALDTKMQRRRDNVSLKSVEKWGLKTEQFVPVTTVMLSPNHWGDKPHGAKHYLFMLDKCHCPDPMRGFFNEYLRSELSPHRKAMDALASQLLCPPTSDQMSGLGFSHTRQDRVIVEVTRRNGTKRTYNVQF